MNLNMFCISAVLKSPSVSFFFLALKELLLAQLLVLVCPNVTVLYRASLTLPDL